MGLNLLTTAKELFLELLFPVRCAACGKETGGKRKNKLKKERYKIVQSDVFENIRGQFDYIFANPPYIDPTKKATVEESVLRHEPHGALFAGSGGLAFITQLLAEARAHLHQGGILMIEFGANQKEDIARLARAHSWNIEFEKDQFGEWRIATLRPRP